MVYTIMRHYVLMTYFDWLLKFSGGSIFLFDRKVLRYFRKDGHSWRKKKDGKTVKEAHEKLKVSIIMPSIIHVFYRRLTMQVLPVSLYMYIRPTRPDEFLHHLSGFKCSAFSSIECFI